MTRWFFPRLLRAKVVARPEHRDRRGWAGGAASVLGLLLLAFSADAQELEPRAFSPSPVGTTFVLGGFGRSRGAFCSIPALDIDNVQADLWVATVGAGRKFGLARTAGTPARGGANRLGHGRRRGP